ncbi:MAG: HdeD family acid-resistance protein [Aestuariivirgaceae bacterium]
MATPARTPRETVVDTWDDIDTPLMHRILQENWWVIALRGILGIIFGLIALFFPGVTILSLVLLFSAYMLVDGAFSIAGALRPGRRNDRWGWMLLSGIWSILTAVVAFLWPGLTAVVFVLILAAWSIVSGALMLAAAFRMRSGARARGWLIFAGIISLLFGALLVLAPLMGAIVLTWWLGAYVLVTSVLMLALAFTLRSRTSRPDGTQGPRTAAAP